MICYLSPTAMKFADIFARESSRIEAPSRESKLECSLSASGLPKKVSDSSYLALQPRSLETGVKLITLTVAVGLLHRFNVWSDTAPEQFSTVSAALDVIVRISIKLIIALMSTAFLWHFCLWSTLCSGRTHPDDEDCVTNMGVAVDQIYSKAAILNRTALFIIAFYAPLFFGQAASPPTV